MPLSLSARRAAPTAKPRASRAGALPALRELRISGCDTGDEGVALLAAGLRERGRLPALRCLYVNAAQVGHG